MLKTLSNTQIESTTVTLIEEHIRHLLMAMGFGEAKVRSQYRPARQAEELATLHIAISAGDNGRILIGVKGNHLFALQHIVRSMIRKKIPLKTRVVVDVNDYLASRERTLQHLAQQAARQAGKTGRAVVLPPMASAERHAIHTCLSSRQDIRTESLGEEPNRRVVVRPVFI